MCLPALHTALGAGDGNLRAAYDEWAVSDPSAFLQVYDDALPHYGYLVRRCANAATAEVHGTEALLTRAKAAFRNQSNGEKIS